MKRYSVLVDSKNLFRFHSNFKRVGILILCLACCGFATYLAMANFVSSVWVDMSAVLSFFLFSLGFIFIFLHFLTLNKNKTFNEVNLNKNYLQIISREEKKSNFVNIPYECICKVEENKKYLNIKISKNLIIPIKKVDFTAEEISMIKFYVMSARYKEQLNK